MIKHKCFGHRADFIIWDDLFHLISRDDQCIPDEPDTIKFKAHEPKPFYHVQNNTTVRRPKRNRRINKLSKQARKRNR